MYRFSDSPFYIRPRVLRALCIFFLVACTTTFFLGGNSFAQPATQQGVDNDDRIVIKPPTKPTLNVPAGFESLVEPQTTVIDIYFGGEYLTSQLATFTVEEIEFSDPAEIVDLIPSLLQPEIIEDDLNGMQPSHPELVCNYQGQSNCGEVEPEVSAVIFSESQFRADLFINSNFLAVQSTSRQKYLAHSDSEWSWLQTFNGAAAGDEIQEGDTYSLNSQSTLAFRENRLQIVSNYHDGPIPTADGQIEYDSQHSFDTVAFRRDWQGMEYQLGYFRSNSGNFQFMDDNKIRGARMASSLDTREDLRQTNGNDLLVFLRSRSEVAIYKDDRLISSRFYDAGNQVLDTSQLPGGAYDVRIQIRDGGGAISEETRFYIKSSQLPPTDQALYFFEAGELLDVYDDDGLAQGTGFSVLRGGYNSRINDQFGYLVGGSAVEDTMAMELGLTHLGRNYDLHLGTVVGNDDRQGARLDFRYQFGPSYFTGSYRQVWNDQFNYENPDLSDFIGPSSKQASIGITTLLPFGRLEVSSRINRRNELDIKTNTVRFELPRYRFGSAELYSGFEISDENGIKTGIFTMEFRFNGDHVLGQLRPQYVDETVSENIQYKDWKTEGVISWQDQELMADKDLRIDVRGRNHSESTSYGAEMDFSSQTGRLRMQTEQTNSRNGLNARRYNGNVFTSFMVNGDSAKLGGRDQTQSALLIKIDGEVSNAEFEILVDGNYRGLAYPGKTTAINLRPYQTYQVTLRQRGDSFVEFEQHPRRVTLYPGNVVTLDWTVSEVDIVFGRIVDSDGSAITNALINGVSGLATTDDIGLFQAELRRDVKTLRVETITSSCEVSVPPYSVSQSIGNLGTLRCDLRPK